MKISIAQLNPKIGDLSGNLTQIKTSFETADADTDLIVFPELCITGYPPKDLLFHQQFLTDVEAHLDLIKDLTLTRPTIALLIGYPKQNSSGEKGVYNMAGIFQNGKCTFEQAKTLLPTYDVFEETRYFDPSPNQKTWQFKGQKIGVLICEDIWFNDAPTIYSQNPIEASLRQGSDCIIAIMASPYEIGKSRRRRNLFKKHASTYKLPILYVNQVGANDDLIFDGHSGIVDAKGQCIHECIGFEASHSTHIFPPAHTHPPAKITEDDILQLKQALILGIKDYTQKIGFSKVLLGLSGGIDSAVVASLAVQALGKENVVGITMPSPYSSQGSVTDSLDLATRLGITVKTVPITPILTTFSHTLEDSFHASLESITEENIQARIRGTILMAHANQYNALLLTTGNKSELAVGYCTLYGDMNGGLGVIADVTKTQVYQLANIMQDTIPKNSITKPPSAELKPNQTDQDTLPPYDVLDAILELHIENYLEETDIIKLGYPKPIVNWVLSAVHKNEHKRRQSATGLKVSSRAFGTGRRMVITSHNRTERETHDLSVR